MKLTIEEIKKHVDRDGQSLNLTRCHIGNDNINLVCRFLSENPQITSLNISRTGITIKGVKALAANTTITTLKLKFSKIGAEAVKAIAANTTIKKLVISWNGIGDKGAIALADNTTITTLKVSGNQITAAGAIALIANTTITSLGLSWNNFGYDGDKAFVEKLKYNTVLINLSHSIEERSMRNTIEKIITRNKVLPWLRTISNARLFAQAQRSDNCPLGKLPIEIAGLINDYVVGLNHFSFFTSQFGKRPTHQDLVAAKQMAS